MKNIAISIIITLGFSLLFIACEQENIMNIDTDIPVVEAYLTPGEPINHVRLTKLIPFLTDDIDSVAEKINDAEITIFSSDAQYKLVPFPDGRGYYYPDTNVLIKENETYSIEFQYKEKLVSASTTTPTKPINLNISQELFLIERMVEGSYPSFTSETYEITWDNVDGSNYYLSIDLMETVIDPVSYMITDTVTQTLSAPSVTNVYNIHSRLLRYYGKYRVVLYKVNEEYANLYESTSTSSQSLTDPYSNIENGKGIFTSFNTDTLFFEVRE
ncbi:MAG: DUF4249 family protein [Bacteroidota bacterium]